MEDARGEDQQERCQPEVRDAESDQAADARGVVRGAVRPSRREDAERDREDEGDHEAVDDQLGRDRDRALQRVGHGDRAHEGVAHVPGEEPLDPVQVLLDVGLVEAELVLHLVSLLGREALRPPGDVVDHVAGHEPDHQEDHDRRRDQRRDRDQDATGGVGGHVGCCSYRPDSTSGSDAARGPCWQSQHADSCSPTEKRPGCSLQRSNLYSQRARKRQPVGIAWRLGT